MEENKNKLDAERTIVFFKTSYSENLELMVASINYDLAAYDAENKLAADIKNQITVILGDKIKNRIDKIKSEIKKWSSLLSEKKTETSEIREVLLSQGNSSDETETLLDLISEAAGGKTIVVETIGQYLMRNGISRINACYELDLDYVSWIDTDRIELLKIIDKADKIITENIENREKLAMAYLKKAQCMQKRKEQVEHFDLMNEELHILSEADTVDDTQNQIKSLIEKALELLPNMPEALMQMGKIYYKESAAGEENIEKAIKMYAKAIQLKPDYAAARNNLGVLYSSESYSRAKNDNLNFEKAVNEYAKAIQIRPFEASYYFNRGRDYSKLEDHEKAVDDFTSAINYGSEEFKKKTLVFHLRGDEYSWLRNYEKAIDDFSESLRLNPDYHKSLLMRGNAYIGAGKKDIAKADFDE
jgi:tetratricopeptide (TPR) repeat protein